MQHFFCTQRNANCCVCVDVTNAKGCERTEQDQGMHVLTPKIEMSYVARN